MMPSILEYTREQLSLEFTRRGFPGYRADQVVRWVYERGATDWDAMSNLSRPLRAQLAAEFTLRSAVVQSVVTARDGTSKLLLRWPDAALTETVVMPGPKRHSACLSSQIGCPVECAFCASGIGGLQRSLTAGEIVEQACWAQQQLPSGQRLSNIVIMGTGEPLANYAATIKAITIINAPWGLDIGARHITLSTVGLPAQIRKLAREPYQITLAVSLHAADDDLRRQLVPWAQNTTLQELFDALNDYYQATHREVTLEYVLLDGVNCSAADADRLAHWARQTRCNVNLINYNPVCETGFHRAAPETASAFLQRLQKHGINTHLRRSRGTDIEAACGQLRRRPLI